MKALLLTLSWQTPRGYLVYKFVLHFEPSPKRFPSSAQRIDVDIECRYQRSDFSSFGPHFLCVKGHYLQPPHCPGAITCTSWLCSPPGEPPLCVRSWEEVHRSSRSSWWMVRLKTCGLLFTQYVYVCVKWLHLVWLMNLDSWSGAAKSQVFQLGKTLNFQISAAHLPAGGKLYINSCYASPSTGSESPLKYTILDNFGWVLWTVKHLKCFGFTLI